MKGETKTRRFELSTIIMSIIMIALPFTFFYLLNQQTSSGYGLTEFSLSGMFAIFSIAFLLWIKSFMKTRPYLGLITGIVGLIAFIYGLIQVYYGSYTTTFAAVGSIIALIYICMNFYRFRKNYSSKNYEDLDNST